MMLIHIPLPEVSGYTMPGYKFTQEGVEVCAEREPEDETGGEDIEEDDGDDKVGEDNSQLTLEKEKQISVDPVSLKQLVKVEGHVSSIASSTGVRMQAPVYLPRIRPKFISSSLPCSATSSPRSDMKSMKKWREPVQKPRPAVQSLVRQHSLALSHFASQQGLNLRRSKSCGEGRSCAPSDEFDVLSRRPNVSQPENGVQVLYECSDDVSDCVKDDDEVDTSREQAFKCVALCLFLPGLSTKKQVAAIKEEREERVSTVSRTVSLEKFECGSWSSATIIDGDDDEGGIQSYFDLPLELISCSTNDAHSPVKTAFVFGRDRKGVPKKSTSRLAPRKSHESSNRHVRFSTSSPTSYPPSPTSSCITPRLRKAREEFNAFLEAQDA